MGLQIWLPLNGDLRQQGLSSATVTGGILSSNGKLGSCYAANSANRLVVTHNLATTSNYTLSFWMKIPATMNSATAWEAAITYHAITSSAGTIGSTAINWASYHNLKIYDDSNHQWLWAAPGNQFQYDQWHLWTLTHTAYETGVECKIYIDGNLINTYRNATQPLKLAPTTMYFGYGITTDRLYFNDIRIYDHTLAPREVKELARGLRVHYKLNDGYIESTSNGLSYQADFASWSSYGFGSTGTKTVLTGWTPNGTNHFCRVGSTRTSTGSTEMARWASGTALSTNGKATFSVYVRGATNMVGRSGFIHVYNSNGTDTQSNTIKNFTFTADWQRVEGQFTWTKTAASSTSYSVYIVGSMIAGDEFDFCEAQFEMKDHATPYVNGTSSGSTMVYDVSGLNNNGTVLNNISIVSAPTRYAVATLFNGTNAKIRLPVLDFSGMTNTYTFSWWQYNISTGNMPWGFSNGNRLNVYHCNPLCWNTGDGANNQFKDGSTTIAPSTLTNAWHHMAVTGDGTSTKLYIDGVYRGTATTYKPLTGTQIYISGWDTGTSYTFNGSKISDFRIYSTTLSQEDIRELYATSAEIDRRGAFYTRELVE